MADEYIDEAVKACLSELEALTAGGKPTGSYDNAWERPPYSLLETTYRCSWIESEKNTKR